MGCGKSAARNARSAETRPNTGANPAKQGSLKPDTSQKNTNPSLPQAIQRDITLDYRFGTSLGKGHFGVVRTGKYISNPDRTFAIKTISKVKVSPDEIGYLKQEVLIMSSLDHPNIVKLFDVYEDARYLHLVMEMCAGGELFDRIIQVGRYSEARAADLLRQILTSVFFMHQNGIAHRDLKPENFLFESSENTSELKLIDFGLSQKFCNKHGQQVTMGTIVGTPYYVAPEVFKQHYGKECDIWSAGVILYILLSGQFPFEGTSNTEILRNVMKGDFNLASGVWTRISIHAKDLIKKMLTKNPAHRISAELALKHPWFDNATEEMITIDPNILQTLREYKAQSKLQKEAMSVLVKYLDVKELKDLKRQFKQLDVTRTGTLTFQEIEQALRNSGIETATSEIQEMISNIDYLGNGEINYSEFLAATVHSKLLINEEHLWTVFNKFDTDNTGFISDQNLVEVMEKVGKTVTLAEVREMIKEVDFKNDGRISFEEFKAMMLPTEAQILQAASSLSVKKGKPVDN